MIDGDGRELPRYKDEWQDGQKELYDEAVGGDPKKVQKVDQKECKCK
jgi:hypothetical protein